MSDDALELLAQRCKAEVSISVNTHRNYYEPVSEYVTQERFLDVPAAVKAEMIARDTVVEVQFYPDTPVGFYFVAHWNVAEALRLAVERLDEATNPQTTRG